VLGDPAVLHAVIFAQEPAERVGCRIRVANCIDFRPVAGRENDCFAAHPARRQAGERRGDSTPREIHAFPQLDGCRPMVQADCEEAHR
jgi:hypothetical protein